MYVVFSTWIAQSNELAIGSTSSRFCSNLLRYNLWNGNKEPETKEAVEDFPANTVLSEPIEQEPDSPDSDDSAEEHGSDGGEGRGEGDTNHSTESRFTFTEGRGSPESGESRFTFTGHG